MTRILSGLLLVACGDDDGAPLGSTCEIDSECASGLCAEQTCLGAEADDDGDGLTNEVEARHTRTSPLQADTDRDGERDGVEVGAASAPRDTDGDGRIDALESGGEDCDDDGLVDEQDDDDGLDPGGACAAFPSHCDAVCAAATRLECDKADICLLSCTGTCADLGAACRPYFSDLTGCLAETAGVSCPARAANPAWRLTPHQGQCAAELQGLDACPSPSR